MQATTRTTGASATAAQYLYTLQATPSALHFRAKLRPLHDVGLAVVCILDANSARLQSLHACMLGQLVMYVGSWFQGFQ